MGWRGVERARRVARGWGGAVFICMEEKEEEEEAAMGARGGRPVALTGLGSQAYRGEVGRNALGVKG